MNKKLRELFFYYAENLGYIPFDEMLQAFQGGESINEWLRRQNVLSPIQISYVKLLIVKYFLLTYAERAKILSVQQCQQLLQRKIHEVRMQRKPLTLYSLESKSISQEFFCGVLANLERQGVFSQQDLQMLLATVLLLPQHFSKTSHRIEQVKTENGYEENVSVLNKPISDLLLQQEFSQHQAHCTCGNSVTLQIESDCKSLNVYCNKCRKQMFSLEKKTSPPKIEGITEQVRQVQRQDKSGKQAFAHYALVKAIGEGAMGRVFLAMDNRNGEEVAVKILQRQNDEKSLQYFRREAEILQRLEHPNIVKFKGIGEHRGIPYFAMEYIKGRSLSDFIRKEGLPAHQVAKMMGFVLEALSYAQQHKLVHRDVKPANIIIGDSGIVKLLDMGIAKMMEDSFRITKTGQILGTSFYLAPEQLSDSKAADHQADIYAVGATIYHALCGIPPYGEYRDNVRRLFWAKLNDSFIRVDERREDLPREIIRIVAKAMAYQKEERYQNAREMHYDLSKFYNEFSSR